MGVRACSHHLAFFQFLKSKKIGIFPGPIYLVALPFQNRLQYCNSDCRMFHRMNFCILCTILVTFGPVTPEFMLEQ